MRYMHFSWLKKKKSLQNTPFDVLFTIRRITKNKKEKLKKSIEINFNRFTPYRYTTKFVENTLPAYINIIYDKHTLHTIFFFVYRSERREFGVRRMFVFRKKRKERKNGYESNTNAFVPTVHARKQVYLGYIRFHRVALSFLRDFFPTEKKGNSVGWAWLVLPSFLSSFIYSFLLPFLPFFRFRWRTRAGYTFRSAEVKREIRGGIWIKSLWKISRSPPQLALLRFTPAGWASIARNTDPSFPSPLPPHSCASTSLSMRLLRIPVLPVHG